MPVISDFVGVDNGSAIDEENKQPDAMGDVTGKRNRASPFFHCDETAAKAERPRSERAIAQLRSIDFLYG